MDSIVLKKRKLLTSGITWLKAHHEELLELYVESLHNLCDSSYADLSLDILRKFALRNLDGMLNRLEGGVQNTERLKTALMQVLSQGGQLTEMIMVADRLLEVFTNYVTQGLVDQPEICGVLLQKVNYIINLHKTTIAVAVIDYQTLPRETKP